MVGVFSFILFLTSKEVVALSALRFNYCTVNLIIGKDAGFEPETAASAVWRATYETLEAPYCVPD